MIIPDFSLHKQLLLGLSLAIGEHKKILKQFFWIFLTFKNFTWENSYFFSDKESIL